MNTLRNNQKLIFGTLAAVTVLSILLAAGFAALYLSSRDTVPAGTDIQTSAKDTETAGNDGVQTPPDTAELSELQAENDALRTQAESLAAELDAMREAASEAETEYIPDPPIDLDSLYNPGDLTPADITNYILGKN